MAYTVRSGENLTVIANRLGTTVDELVRLNNISNRNLVFEGQELVTPDAAPAEAPAAQGNASSVEGQRAKGRSNFGAIEANFRGTGQQVMGPRAGDGDKTPAPVPPSNPDRTAAAAMYDVGMGAPAQATLDYSVPVQPQGAAPISAPRPGSLTTGAMTPIPGPAQPADPRLAASLARENALAQQRADEPQRIAAVDAQWRQRDAAPAESPVAGAMMAAAPEPTYQQVDDRQFANSVARGVDPAAVVAGMPRVSVSAPGWGPQADPYAGMTLDQIRNVDRRGMSDEEWAAWNAAYAAAIRREGAAGLI